MQDAARPLPEVGVAIDQPALRETVSRALLRSKRYSARHFSAGDRDGTAGSGACAAMVTTLGALRDRHGDFARRKKMGCPIVVILSDGERVDDSAALAAADAFLSAGKVGTLLPAAIMLSAFRLSAIPARFSPAGAALMWK